jgi:membrane-associated protease RseP (regulator of RpoE activity)
MASHARCENKDQASLLDSRARGEQAISRRAIPWAILLLALCGSVAAWLIVARPIHIAGNANRPTLPDMTVEPASDPSSHDGQALLVTSVRSAGVAAQQGLRVGDLLEGVDGQPVSSLDDLARALRADGNIVLTLHLRRGDHPLDLRLDRRGRGGANGA